MLIPWPKTSLATVAIPGLLYASHPLVTEPVFHCSMLIVCCPTLGHRTSFSLFQAHCMLLIPWWQSQFFTVPRSLYAAHPLVTEPVFHCSRLIAWCSLHVPRTKHHCHHSMITELICHLHIVPGYYDLLLHAGGLLLLEAPQVDSPQESKDRFQELKMDWHSSQPSLVFTSGGSISLPWYQHLYPSESGRLIRFFWISLCCQLNRQKHFAHQQREFLENNRLEKTVANLLVHSCFWESGCVRKHAQFQCWW